MNILVVGANGRIGSRLVNKLANEGNTVYAASRSNKGSFSGTNNIYPINLDLLSDLPQIIKSISNIHIDAIYFTAGSKGENLLQIDAFGAVKIIQAAEALGIKRFIMLSSLFALNPEFWSDESFKSLTNYNIAKFFADSWLINQSKLSYTILQPGPLQEIEGSGRIQTKLSTPMPNSLDNVVDTLAKILVKPNTIGHVITMADGDIPIEDVLNSISE